MFISNIVEFHFHDALDKKCHLALGEGEMNLKYYKSFINNSIGKFRYDKEGEIEDAKSWMEGFKKNYGFDADGKEVDPFENFKAIFHLWTFKIDIKMAENEAIPKHIRLIFHLK